MHSTSSSPSDLAGMAVHASTQAHCRHCGAALAGRFCHACGEDAMPPETSWDSWVRQWHRFVRTMRSLWFAPGELAVERQHGVRVGTIPPLTLFLNAVALFFLFSAATQFQLTSIAEQNHVWMGPIIEQQMAATNLSQEALLERADRRFQAIYTVCLALISGVGYMLIYRLLYRRSLRGWQGAFTLSLYYLAFLFTLFLPWMLLIPIVRAKFGDGATFLVLVVGVLVALLWQSAAARRIGGHGWPMAVAKGLAVVVWGFVLDSFMTVVAIWIALRLA